MTPAETLRAAADRIDALDVAVPGGKWERVTDYINTDVWKDVQIGTTVDGLDLPLLETLDGSLAEREAAADLVCALRPVARPLAESLRQVAKMLDGVDGDMTAWGGPVCTLMNDLLNVARAVLGAPS